MTGPRQNVRMALFALSGNQCAFPECSEPMFDAGTGTILGEVCHIYAQSPGGPRYNGGLSAEELHSIGNLILLCRAHHKIVDEHPDKYSADHLRRIKAEHESRAATTPPQTMLRLIQALAPDVPDNW
ncbi:MAG: HNH endonuclease [Chloroflexi bacterium]|nr:HNH endonuclease [Chloroflexota bacterium]